MTAPVSSNPPAIDYTNRDFFSLREALIQQVKLRVNSSSSRQWTGDDPADFGVALIEAFAYMGDILNYYIDRVANENYLSTAVQRQNIINLANSYSYTVSGYRAAYCTVTLSNSTASDVTVPAGTQLLATILVDEQYEDLIFTTEYEITVSANDTNTVPVSHGEAISLRAENLANGGEQIGISDGSISQSYVLSENQIVDDSVIIYVKNGPVTTTWTKVEHLLDYGPLDLVYTTTFDADNYITVYFGDGVSGAVPTSGSIIIADYKVGGGSIGNIAENIITEFYAVPGGSAATLNSELSIDGNTIGVGGADPESNDSIRINAPISLRTINRAVSLEDYPNLVIGLAGVGKAAAVSEIPSSVSLYIGIQQDDLTEEKPGMELDGVTPTANWYLLKNVVSTYLEGKTLIGTTVTINPPTFVNASVEVEYSAYPQYDSAVVASAIKSAIQNTYSYTNSSFGAVISPEGVESALLKVEGVRAVSVKYLYRNSASAARNILFGEKNEIFVFSDADITVTASSSDASLSAISLSSGTLSPSFATGTKSYTTSVTTATVTVTPTQTNSGASVFVNGTADSAVISTGTVGQTYTATIKIIAADRYTTDEYKVYITRA